MVLIAIAEQQTQIDARNRHLGAVNKTAEERLARLTATIKMLERACFGRCSERLRARSLSETGIGQSGPFRIRNARTAGSAAADPT
ncbi:hypothetical protein NKJ95_32245 [Mesorhizobium sp. M0012]|uniref:hypothetical protein n=1 Tax=Mesorhizobium sp. M0012 TaxID=2956840 RepID=UPI003338C242